MDTIQSEDRIQKTWIPEGTIEYKTFKHVTQENNFLGSFLKEKFTLLPGDLLLDVGGREGDISITLQLPEYIHIIDPDPTLHLPFKPGKFLNAKIQNVLPLPEKYKLIICSHVLGYLGNQNVQSVVFSALLDQLEPGGTIVLFYNTNAGYMGELLKFSKENLSKGHYDYFDESLLQPLHPKKYEIQYHDIAFKLDYDSYEDWLGAAGFFSAL
jgi:SAM-dependent methyltransferase